MALNQYNEPPWEGDLEARKNSSMRPCSRPGGSGQILTPIRQRSRTGTKITGRLLPHRPRSDRAQGDPTSKGDGEHLLLTGQPQGSLLV